MEKPRQTTLLQIFGSMSNKKSQPELVQQPSELKKEQIFQSGQDSPFNIAYPLKPSKKQCKLLTFLATINPEFKQELADFLIKHKEEYNNRQPKNICLYEDVLFIFGYKTSEEKIRTNKKAQIDQLTKQLEQATKKKAITIKERVEKKLVNLTIDEIRSFMRTNTDISFNDKKQLNNKPNPTSKGSLTPNEEPRSNKSIDRVEETIQNKAANQQIIEKPKTAQKPKKADEGTSKTSLFNRSIYSYGSKIIRQNIKFFFNPATNTLMPFKKSQIDILQKAEKSSSDTNMPVQMSSDNVVMTQLNMRSGESNKKQVKVEREVVEFMDSYLHKEKLINEPQMYKNYIQKIKLHTLKTLEELQKGEKTQQNLRAIAELQQKIHEITRLLNEVSLQKQTKKPQPESTSMKPEKNYSEEEDSRNIQLQKQSKQLPTTGKKSLPKYQQNEMKSKPSLCFNMSQSEAANQLKRLMNMISNNERYFQIIKNDPSKLAYYAWNEEQDKILWSFKFSPNTYRSQMLCLLRYKTMSMIRQRIQFLKIEIDQKLSNELRKLTEEDRLPNNNSDRVSFRGEEMQIQVNDRQ